MMMMMLLLLFGLLMTTGVVLCDDAHINGTWSGVKHWPLVSIHMVLLKSGKVLSYGADANVTDGKYLGFHYDVWDPTSNIHQTLGTDHNDNVGTNIFCSGQVVVPATGEVMITGGTQVINGTTNLGVAHVQFFDPETESLHLADRNMHRPRWYPSVTVLPNSNVLVQGGRDDQKKPVTTPELYNPKTKRWRLLTGANSNMYKRAAWWYPRSYLTTGNQVLVFPQYTNQIWKLDPSGKGSLELVGTVPGPDFSNKAPATMFDRRKLLLIQGVQQASVVNLLNPDKPVSQPTGSLREPRYWANSVALPNGEVLVVGGASVLQEEKNAVKYAEIWNPKTGEWRVGASAVKSRLYHSTALLLPDATVLVSGGGRPGPVINQNAEIYEPPYLFQANGTRATRPVIASLSGEPQYGQTFQVDFTGATKIIRACLIRLGAVTHSFNNDERMLRLGFEQHSNALSLDVNIAFSINVGPPGSYMLFIVDEKGVPSVAKIIDLPGR